MGTVVVPPSGRAGVVSARPVCAGIDRKVAKYRAIARKAGLPLVVAAGVHRFTSLEVQQLDDLVVGVPTLSVQFDLGDSFIHEPVEIDPNSPPRWTMPPGPGRSALGEQRLPLHHGLASQPRAPSGLWPLSCSTSGRRTADW
ncbi:hypothetical protein [Streptomyces sp. NPDC089799]|uniref:hypothetical protein n=1 Tax=Streptomyces sp. NPDC089799 TaxID=3155066 RepID=UPI003419F8EE